MWRSDQTLSLKLHSVETSDVSPRYKTLYIQHDSYYLFMSYFKVEKLDNLALNANRYQEQNS